MASVNRSKATLRIVGDLVEPDQITAILGGRPSDSQRKGEIRVGKVSGRAWTIKTGMWRLKATDQDPGDIDKQVEELLGALTSELSVWRELGERFRLDLFCGLFMEESNEGLTISAKTLRMLGERGVEIGFDIYSELNDLPKETTKSEGSAW